MLCIFMLNEDNDLCKSTFLFSYNATLWDNLRAVFLPKGTESSGALKKEESFILCEGLAKVGMKNMVAAPTWVGTVVQKQGIHKAKVVVLKNS